MEYFLFLSDLGRFALVQTGYLIKGRFPFILRQDKSFGLEVGGCRQGPRPGGRDPNPGEGTQTRGHEPETWRQETGCWKPRRPKLRILMLDPAGLACAS